MDALERVLVRLDKGAMPKGYSLPDDMRAVCKELRERREAMRRLWAAFEPGGEEALLELPEHLRDGIRAYVQEGREVGGFLRSVIENDLEGAVKRMNPASFEDLLLVVGFFEGFCPGPCWGREGRYVEWRNRFKEVEAAP